MSFTDIIIYDIIKTLVIVIGTLGMMCSTTNFRYRSKHIATLFLIYLCYVAISSAAIITWFGFTFFMRILLLTISAPAVVLVFKLTQEKPAKAIFNYATQIMFSLYVSASITLINAGIHGTKLTDFVIRVIVYSLIILLEYRFLRRPFLHLYEIVTQGWMTLSLIPCSLCVFLIALASYPIPYTENPTGVIFIYLTGIIIIIIYFAIFQYLVMQHRYQKAKHDLEMISVKENLTYESLKISKEDAEELASFRHDMLHHLNALLKLSSEGQTADLTDYLSRLTKEAAEIPTLQFTPHPTVNAILSIMHRRSDEAGILFDIRVNIPASLPIPDPELVSLLMNMLDNAICAASAIEEKIKKWVSLTMHVNKNYLFIETANSCDKPPAFASDGLPVSERGKGHGYGIKSMQEIARQYQSELIISAENNSFRIQTALLIPKTTL